MLVFVTVVHLIAHILPFVVWPLVFTHKIAPMFGSMKLGKLFGIDTYVHGTFWLLPLFVGAPDTCK